MPYDYGSMGRIPVDPRVIQKIQRSPSMMAEQGAGFMSGWGGPSMYQVFAQLPKNQRITYAAVLDGHTEPNDISIVTGLTTEQVEASLSQLEERGLVEVAQKP